MKDVRVRESGRVREGVTEREGVKGGARVRGKGFKTNLCTKWPAGKMLGCNPDTHT